MNILINFVTLLLLVTGVITIPTKTWFGREVKPVMRQIPNLEYTSHRDFFSNKEGKVFESIERMYWYILDTKKGRIFEYAVNDGGEVTMYIVE